MTEPTSRLKIAIACQGGCWIDDRDFAPKGMFTFLLIFFSLAEAGAPSPAPFLTLPVN